MKTRLRPVALAGLAIALSVGPVWAADTFAGIGRASTAPIQQPQGGSPVYAIDDGTNENNIGINSAQGTQIFWMNRFDIDPLDLGPLQIDQVQVFFDPTTIGPPVVGNAVSLHIYSDADTNPANGATHIGSQDDQVAQVGTTFDTYALVPAPQIAAGVNLLVGVVNRWTTTGVTPQTFPAAIDQTVPNNVRSWAGFTPGFDLPNPPPVPVGTFGTIDSFGLPGDWLVRASGTVLPVELMNFSVD